jgi:Ca2+-binding EF-hand superfamily protein
MEETAMTQGTKTGRAMALAATTAVLLSAPAFAEHPDRAKLDTNGDGRVDLAEAQAARPDFTKEKFNAADANSDGQLSDDEWSNLPRKGHRYGHLDANKDGHYTLEEVRAAHPDLTEQEYSSFDANKDGKVTKDELKQTIGSRLFDNMDTDGDGGLSLQEVKTVRSSVTQEKFATMDTDSNGLLSMDEMRAAHKSHAHHGDDPQAEPAKPGND